MRTSGRSWGFPRRRCSLSPLFFKWRDLPVLFCFDPEWQARIAGLCTLVAATVVFFCSRCWPPPSLPPSRQLARALVIATLVTPGATAYLLTDRFGRMLFLAGAQMGAITSAVGAYASYFVNGAPGGVHRHAVDPRLFSGTLFFAPKHGMLTQRRRGRGGPRSSLICPMNALAWRTIFVPYGFIP